MRMILSVAVSGLLLGSAGVASADACGTVLSAYEALAVAPAYRQSVEMAGSPTLQMVTIGDTLYMNDGTDWKQVPLQPGMRVAMMKQMMPSADALKDCSMVGTEEIGGVATTIYGYQPPPIEGAGPLGPQKVWIGDADGLPHRMTSADQGAAVQVEISFDGVTAPIP